MSLKGIDSILSPMFAAVFASFRSKDFDQSEMRLVKSSCGFDEMVKIEYLDDDKICWKTGAIGAIGENAKRRDGTSFTAFLVSTGGDKMEVKTLAEIRHVPETGLPALWVEALRKGWKISLCPTWTCGCNFVWMKPLSSGNHEVFGCLSHTDVRP